MPIIANHFKITGWALFNTPGYRDLFIDSGQIQGAVTNVLVEKNTIADSLWNGRRAEGDFHLQSGSQAIDAGVNVGLLYRGNAPDLGALEFGAPAPSPTPTPNPGLSPLLFPAPSRQKITT
jgi:hypothetical protein